MSPSPPSKELEALLPARSLRAKRDRAARKATRDDLNETLLFDKDGGSKWKEENFRKPYQKEKLVLNKEAEEELELNDSL